MTATPQLARIHRIPCLALIHFGNFIHTPACTAGPRPRPDFVDSFFRIGIVCIVRIGIVWIFRIGIVSAKAKAKSASLLSSLSWTVDSSALLLVQDSSALLAAWILPPCSSFWILQPAHRRFPFPVSRAPLPSSIRFPIVLGTRPLDPCFRCTTARSGFRNPHNFRRRWIQSFPSRCQVYVLRQVYVLSFRHSGAQQLKSGAQLRSGLR
ncbi:hypothetical protein C8R43DRAFT_182997 [Mycena crocata]|nr:hypothetical protein C8R43DRAFT_182997 [Mycena crocata]